MKSKIKLFSLSIILSATYSIQAQPHLQATKAVGLGLNMPLVGRLIGGGGVLYSTALDVTNNPITATQVDFYLDGIEITTGNSIALDGSISSSGALVTRGTGGQMPGRSNAHFDDFVDSLVTANLLPASVKPNGFIGSVLFIFDGYSKRGQGGVSARFFNSFGGGTIGVSLAGHPITTSEPTQLVATLRDTRGKPGAQLYSNLFVNNSGLTPSGFGGPAGPVTVQFQAYSTSSGLPVGSPRTIPNINPGATVSFGDVLTVLQVPAASEDSFLVYATVISGNAAIEGVAVQVDAITKDGSAVEMSRADF